MSGELLPRRMLPIARPMGMQTFPDRAAGSVVTANASSFIYGSWVTVTPSSGGFPWDVFIHGLLIGPSTLLSSTSMVWWQLQLGVGDPGFEAPISVFKTHSAFSYIRGGACLLPADLVAVSIARAASHRGPGPRSVRFRFLRVQGLHQLHAGG